MPKRKASRPVGRPSWMQLNDDLKRAYGTISELLTLWDEDGAASEFADKLEELREQLPGTYRGG